MNQYQRLKFYIACFFKDLKWKLCADKQIEEFEQSLVPEESVSGAEVKLIEDIIFMDEEEQKEQKPALEPRRTMLFISGRRRRCNFLNAWWYRRAILRNYHWGKQRGFTEYVADPYSPFGLLAMETLGRLKRSGEKLLLYSVHSCHVGQRRSYRLIPETGLEVLFLENAVCDYIYRQLIPEEVPEAVFTNVGAFCTEGGILSFQAVDTSLGLLAAMGKAMTAQDMVLWQRVRRLRGRYLVSYLFWMIGIKATKQKM